MQNSQMQELTMEELQQVNGGNPAVVMIAVMVGRRYGGKALAFVGGAVAAWMAE